MLIRAAVAVLGALEDQLLGIAPGDGGQASVIGILGWGPKDSGRARSKGVSQTPVAGAGEEGHLGRYWILDAAGNEDGFMEMVRDMGKKP